MAETMNLSTSKMSDDDLKAIATYLKDRPGDPDASGQNGAQSREIRRRSRSGDFEGRCENLRR